MTYVYSRAQLAELEALAFSQGDETPTSLMQKAGQAVFDSIQRQWPHAQSIGVVCGPGSNGGDGMVVARLAKQAGLTVTVFLAAELRKPSGAIKDAYDAAMSAGVSFVLMQPDFVCDADIVVDALFGTGIDRPIEPPYTAFIESVNASDGIVVSIDLPSGLDANTGCEYGTAVQANHTVSLLGAKQGLYLRQGRVCSGEIEIVTLGISDTLLRKIEPSAELLAWDTIKSLLPRRPRDAFKNDFGHVLIIGGDYGMGGAVRMAAEAAMRVGAGLVTVATRPEHISVVSGMRPEAMCVRATCADDIRQLIERATTIVIGPGLGKGDWSKELLSAVLESDLPKVLDADALNLLSQAPCARQDWVLTPHPGEASRLLQCGTADVQDDRLEAARELQHRYDGVTVLKGSGTVIKGTGRLPYICTAGNPGMATGGMGDILSGMIGGLLAQGLTLEQAAEAGVFIHAKAADLAADQQGERGLLATDVLSHLGVLVNPYLQSHD